MGLVLDDGKTTENAARRWTDDVGFPIFGFVHTELSHVQRRSVVNPFRNGRYRVLLMTEDQLGLTRKNSLDCIVVVTEQLDRFVDGTANIRRHINRIKATSATTEIFSFVGIRQLAAITGVGEQHPNVELSVHQDVVVAAVDTTTVDEGFSLTNSTN